MRYGVKLLFRLLCHASWTLWAAVAPPAVLGLERLPAVLLADEPLVSGPLGPSVALDASPRQFSEPLLSEQEQSALESGIPPGARDGVFQNASFIVTWLPTLGTDELGFTDLELSSTLGFPFPTPQSPLLITPYFAAHFIDSPNATDLPAHVYDASVEFRWLRPIGERWAMDLSVEPGVHSDFEAGDADALRIAGRGVGIYHASPTTTWVLGVAYLDRPDVSVLPVGGLIWTPSDDWRLELVVPRPRIAWRAYNCNYDWCGQYWFYLAGEFGGGSWSIRQPSGVEDEMTIRDYRLLLGIENKIHGELSHRIEVGYVFGREVEFTSGTGDFEPDDALLVRLGMVY